MARVSPWTPLRLAVIRKHFAEYKNTAQIARELGKTEPEIERLVWEELDRRWKGW